MLIPIAALVVAGAATAVGISMTSSADDAPASPIVVTAPQRAPAAPAPAGSDLPAAPGPNAPGSPAMPAAPRVTAEPKAPPPPADVPAPPPPITGGGDDDWDDDGGWDD